MKNILSDLFEYKTLNKSQAYSILTNLAEGVYNECQIAAFLAVYRMRSITVHELQGFMEAMQDLCVQVPIDEYDAMDLCGTGGDGKDTFNISTLSSFIVAGAGQNVAKHGNNGVSSICGSSNILQHLGYNFTNDVDKIKKSLDKAGICFLHAPLFHPAMKNVAPVRKALGIKTFFNMLGPLVNPSKPNKQLVGVFSLELARLYYYLHQQSKKDFVILHSLDGYDEVSLTGSFKTFSKTGEQLLSPKDLGLHLLNANQIAGGDTIKESAAIFLKVLQGKGTRAQTEVVLANAGLALHCGKNVGIEEGVAMAKESLESGAAYNTLKKLIEQVA